MAQETLAAQARAAAWRTRTTNSRALAVVGAVTLATVATPALAVVPLLVSTDEASFDAGRPGYATYSFPFTGSTSTIAPTYALGGVTFSSPSLTEIPTNYDAISMAHLAENTGTLTVNYNGPVLGLTLAAFNGAQTINYVVDGIAGTLALPANMGTAFIGFDTGGTFPSITASFTNVAGTNIDVLGFQTAVPEPAAWGMMTLGIGAIGFTMRRRRQKAAARVSFA